MAQIGNVSEINSIKDHLDQLKDKGLIKEWEIPYEHILTRLTAAIFFLTPADESKTDEIWKELVLNEGFHYSLNDSKNLSSLMWRLEFNKETRK